MIKRSLRLLAALAVFAVCLLVAFASPSSASPDPSASAEASVSADVSASPSVSSSASPSASAGPTPSGTLSAVASAAASQDTSPALPLTGVNVRFLLVAGALLLGTGGVAYLLARRRRVEFRP